MSSKRIFVQVGSIQESFRDRGFYPKKSCDLIEDVVNCDKSKLTDNGGNGRIRFVDEDGNMVVQLSVIKGKSLMTDESKSIVVIRSNENSIVSDSYFGVDAELDFISNTDEYYMSGVENHISSLKSFYNSWQVKKGEISAVVIIVEERGVFEEIIKDSFFDSCYVLLAD